MHPDFPLRRFLRCPKCNAPVRGYPVSKKNGKRYRYYDCENAMCRFRVSVEQAHKLFVKLLQEMAPIPRALKLFRELVLREWELRWDERRAVTDGAQARVALLRKERESLLTLMKRTADSPSLLAEFQKDFGRVDRELALAGLARNEAEVEEYDAEAVVGACTYFLSHASELWQKWPPEAKKRLQAMVFPEGVSFADLEGKQTAKRSVIYDALTDSADSGTMAAPRCRMANSVLQELIEWYETIRSNPGMGQVVSGC